MAGCRTGTPARPCGRGLPQVTAAPGGRDVVRALICEDEPLAVRALREYLKDVDWIEILDDARDGRTAMRLIHKLEPDLVFMDVRMPGLTGIEVLEAVTHRPAVVFTTAHDDYAISAFELGAVDYLVKPFGKRRLLETLARVRVRLLGEGRVGRPTPATPAARPRHADRLFARHRESIVPVPTDDIVRIDAANDGAELVTADRRFRLGSTLTEIEERLDPRDFLRIHRSHIINLAHVAAMDRYDGRRLSVKLDDGSSIIASRRGSRELKRLTE